MSVYKLIEGHKHFKQNIFQLHEKEYCELVKQDQQPKVLFIGCSDSRVLPALITDAKPGDFFIIRNVGNIVPTYNPENGQLESAAAIEFAVNILNVSEIVVCGHSHCGACRGLYQKIDDPNLDHLKHWLELNAAARQYSILNQTDENESEEALYRRTEHISVVCQIQNLLTYPFIQKRIKEKTLFLHGWYYNIETGEIKYYDSERFEFRPLEEYLDH